MRLGGLGEDDGARGDLVDAVGRHQRLAGIVGQVDDVGIMPLADDGDPGRLVEHEHGVVLVEHVTRPELDPVHHQSPSVAA